MHKTLVCVFVAAGVLQGCSTLSTPASTASDRAAAVGYVNDANAERIMTSAGDCVQVNTWSTDSMMVECQASAKTEVSEPEPVKKIVSLSFDGTALFDFDSSELSAAGRGELDSLVARIGENSDVGAINVVGHADSLGPTQYNQQLSERRASSVVKYLQTSLPNVSILSSGKGEMDPVADNSTETGRQRNRRVEVQVDAKVEKAIFE